MTRLAPTDQQLISDAIKALIRSSRPIGDLDAAQLEKTNAALTRLMNHHPETVKGLDQFPRYLGLVRACHHVKTGGTGTWHQVSRKATTEVRTELKAAGL